MCRHLAYLGPPVPLAALLFDPPHSLAHQSWAPRDMRGGGTVNADGFGVGWWPPAGGGPVRYRRDRPIWSEPDLPALAVATTAPAVLAAVRSATAGMPAGEEACAPFTGDGWLFSLNGRIAGWPGSAARLATRLPAEELLSLAPLDSALVWALVRHRLRAMEPGDAVLSTVAEIAVAAPGSRLNLLLSDGRQIIATALTHALWVREGGGAVLVASEPLDGDPGWRAVQDGTLLTASAGTVRFVPLPVAGAADAPVHTASGAGLDAASAPVAGAAGRPPHPRPADPAAAGEPTG